jgi:exonuclease III
MEQNIETGAVKINLLTAMMYVICSYRSPTGNFVRFVKGIDTILNQLGKPDIEIIVCGDINIDYLDENCYKRQQLGTLLATYNLISTVRFPTNLSNR